MPAAPLPISVVGAGYVGLVTAVGFAELGHTVCCLEIDPARLGRLRDGQLPFHEPGLDRLLARHHAAGRLSFTDDYAAAIPAADIVFIAVHTPPAVDGRADLRFVVAAARSILAHARPGLTIAVKSTVPPGTGDELAALAASAGIPGIETVANPEFLRQGSAVRDVLAPDRVVVGAESPAAAELLANLYAPLGAPILVCGRRSAELAKYAANGLLASRVSFMNEIAAICEAVGADIEEVARVVGADARIGPGHLRAGLGWGGSCFPKDVQALTALAADHGRPTPILDAVLDVNAWQRERAADLLLDAVGDEPDATVGVLGLAFKPDTDDLRGSPAVAVIERLLAAGVRVRAHDPVAIPAARALLPGVAFVADAAGVAAGSDALLLATEWPEYSSLDWPAVRAAMRGRLIVDGRNALPAERLHELGFVYVGFGRPRQRSTAVNGARSTAAAAPAQWSVA